MVRFGAAPAALVAPGQRVMALRLLFGVLLTSLDMIQRPAAGTDLRYEQFE